MLKFLCRHGMASDDINFHLGKGVKLLSFSSHKKTRAE